jgi:hypothetical protein
VLFKKSTAISKKSNGVERQIFLQFDVPQIKSRISVLITKVRMLDLYIHLDKIPDDKGCIAIRKNWLLFKDKWIKL